MGGEALACSDFGDVYVHLLDDHAVLLQVCFLFGNEYISIVLALEMASIPL